MATSSSSHANPSSRAEHVSGFVTTKETDFTLNILLWNVDTGSESKRNDTTNVTGYEIGQTMEPILARIIDYKNLVVLCTDKLSIEKHKILVNFVKGRRKPNTHAEVYYHNTDDAFTVKYLKGEDLQKKVDSRAAACILTSKKGCRVLVVSWHGPRAPANEEKLNRLRDLLHTVDRIKVEHGCDSVVLGGDFNVSSEDARKVDELLRLNGEVADNYKKPPDRQNVNKLDYILVWPKTYFNINTTEVIADDLRLDGVDDGGTRIFDHPLVLYNISDPLGEAVQKAETSLRKEGAELTFSFTTAVTFDRARSTLHQIPPTWPYQGVGVVVDKFTFERLSPTRRDRKLTDNIFLAHKFCHPRTLVEFDRDLRGQRLDCVTVYGLFRLKGHLSAANSTTPPIRKDFTPTPEGTESESTGERQNMTTITVTEQRGMRQAHITQFTRLQREPVPSCSTWEPDTDRSPTDSSPGRQHKRQRTNGTRVDDNDDTERADASPVQQYSTTTIESSKTDLDELSVWEQVVIIQNEITEANLCDKGRNKTFLRTVLSINGECLCESDDVVIVVEQGWILKHWFVKPEDEDDGDLLSDDDDRARLSLLRSEQPVDPAEHLLDAELTLKGLMVVIRRCIARKH